MKKLFAVIVHSPECEPEKFLAFDITVISPSSSFLAWCQCTGPLELNKNFRSGFFSVLRVAGHIGDCAQIGIPHNEIFSIEPIEIEDKNVN